MANLIELRIFPKTPNKIKKYFFISRVFKLMDNLIKFCVRFNQEDFMPRN